MVDDQEKWAREFLTELNEIGINCTADAAKLLGHLHAQGYNPTAVFSIISAHNASIDYLESMDGLLRATVTAKETLFRLKHAFDCGQITREQWVKNCSLVAPFLNPSVETKSHAEDLISKLGAQPVSICIRGESDFEKNSKEAIRNGYDNYLKKY
jgi:hypothetical protein